MIVGVSQWIREVAAIVVCEGFEGSGWAFSARANA